MDHISLLTIIGLILASWTAYRGMNRLLEEKEILFDGIELLIFVLFFILFWLLIFVPGFWQ